MYSKAAQSSVVDEVVDNTNVAAPTLPVVAPNAQETNNSK
jgi:hypothetical protein